MPEKEQFVMYNSGKPVVSEICFLGTIQTDQLQNQLRKIYSDIIVVNFTVELL